jgi:ankyrin repeat protein
MIASDGITPLMSASSNGHIAVVNSLLKAGADVNKERKQGGTALDLASQNGHITIVDLLLKAGADVNKARNNGQTSLIIASNDGNTEIVRLLLAAGADVSIKVNGHSVYNFASDEIKKILPPVVVPNPLAGSHNGGGRRKSRKPRKYKRKTRRNY